MCSSLISHFSSLLMFRVFTISHSVLTMLEHYIIKANIFMLSLKLSLHCVGIMTSKRSQNHVFCIIEKKKKKELYASVEQHSFLLL